MIVICGPIKMMMMMMMMLYCFLIVDRYPSFRNSDSTTLFLVPSPTNFCKWIKNENFAVNQLKVQQNHFQMACSNGTFFLTPVFSHQEFLLGLLDLR